MIGNYSTQSDNLVLEIADEFLDRHRSGEHPTIREYTERYPQLEERLRKLLPAIARLESAAHIFDPADSVEAGLDLQRMVREQTSLGGFRLIRELGRGGMGVVYEAEQTALKRRVALKILTSRRPQSEIEQQRFQREATAAAKLHHTNIVPVFAVGQQDGIFYYAMQLIEGQSLANWIDHERLADTCREKCSDTYAERQLVRANSSTPAASSARENTGDRDWHRRIASIGTQIADALHFAHSKGVLHRDVKPANILIDNQGNPWVADFGLAKLEDDEDLTRDGDVIGTFRYIAPESFDGLTDERSEVYSLGLTLYELVAMGPAFEQKERSLLVRQITEGKIVPLQKRVPGTPRELSTVIHKAIRRDPRDRYRTALELSEDLRRFANDEPILARHMSAIESFRRWAGRNRVVASLGAMLVVLILLFSVSSSFAALYFRSLEEEQRHAAITNKKLARDFDQKRREAESNAVDLRLSLVDMHRAHGLRAEEDGHVHLAAVWFVEAARLARGFDQQRHRRNMIRAQNALKFCPRPVALLDASTMAVDRMTFHASNQWLIARPVKQRTGDVLWNLESQSLHAFAVEFGRVTALEWSPAGDQLAVGTASGRVLLLAFPSFEVLRERDFEALENEDVVVTDFVFTSEGAGLICSRGNRIYSWSIAGFELLGQSEKFAKPINNLVLSLDETIIAAVTADTRCSALRVDALDSVLFRKWHHQLGNSGANTLPVFDSAGRLMTWNNGLNWVDLATGKQRHRKCGADPYRLIWLPGMERVFCTQDIGHRGYFWSWEEEAMPVSQVGVAAALHPDQKTLLASNGRGNLVSYRLQQRDWQPTGVSQADRFRALAFSPEGRLLATAGVSGEIRIWRWHAEESVFTTIASADQRSHGVASSDSSRALVRTESAVQVFGLCTGEFDGPLFKPNGRLIDAAWSADEQSVITLARRMAPNGEGFIDVWDWRTGQRRQPTIRCPRPRFRIATPDPLIAIDPGGQQVAYISQYLSALVVNLQSGEHCSVNLKRVRTLRSLGKSPKFLAGVQSYGGRLPATLSLISWDDLTVRGNFNNYGGTECPLSADGRFIGVELENGFIVYDCHTLQPVGKPLVQGGEITFRSLTTKGKVAAGIVGGDGVCVWNWETRECLGSPIKSSSDQAELTPNGKLLVVPGSDGKCRIFETATGQRICPPIDLGQDNFTTTSGHRVHFSPDSRFAIVTGNPNITVIDLPKLNPELIGIETLALESEIVSGHRFGDEAPVALGSKEWRDRWEAHSEESRLGDGVRTQ